jgi:CelD/BcsL family acetyltransferase involved in cellulose biosynthesis
MLRIESIETYEQFLSLKPIWNPLLEKSDNNCVFLTWEWLTLWWDTFEDGKELYILLVTNDNEPVAIAPLMKTSRLLSGIKLRSIEFIGSGHDSMPDHMAFITLRDGKIEYLKKIFDHLISIKSSWDIISLRDMLHDKTTFDELGHLLDKSVPYDVLLDPQDICPYIPLPPTWEGFLSKLSKKWRYRIKTYEKEMQEAHPFTFSLIEDSETLSASMKMLEMLHRKRMKEKGLEGDSLNASFWDFHNKIARSLLPEGRLLLGALTTNGKMIAFNYAFAYNKTVSYYQSGLDPEFNQYSAGFLLNAYMIRESIKRGFCEFDFLRGNEEYKFRFTDKFRQNAELTSWSNNPGARFARGVLSLNRGFKKMLGFIKARK